MNEEKLLELKQKAAAEFNELEQQKQQINSRQVYLQGQHALLVDQLKELKKTTKKGEK